MNGYEEKEYTVGDGGDFELRMVDKEPEFHGSVS